MRGESYYFQTHSLTPSKLGRDCAPSVPELIDSAFVCVPFLASPRQFVRSCCRGIGRLLERLIRLMPSRVAAIGDRHKLSRGGGRPRRAKNVWGLSGGLSDNVSVRPLWRSGSAPSQKTSNISGTPGTLSR